MTAVMKHMGFRGETLVRHDEAGHKLIDDVYDHVRVEPAGAAPITALITLLERDDVQPQSAWCAS